MPEEEGRPNILIIMSDQHNRHVLGCYGNPIVRTPNLDRLAAQGMRFNDAYCPAPLCVPSRMSFMTSRHPFRNRAWTNGHILSSAVPTWAHVLGAAGYETSLVGRMHFVGPDQRHGFENRPIGEYFATQPGAPIKGGPWWTKFPIQVAGQCRLSAETAGTGTTTYQWADRQVTLKACEYLRAHASGEGRPFAAVVGYLLPHCPFIAPKELFDYYCHEIDLPAIEEIQPDLMKRWRDYRGILDPPLPEERIRIARAAYFAMCEQIDGMIGTILNCLDETGLADNTLVLYTSDHGDMAGEHGCFWKMTYYEGSAGVPLIARLPGAVEPGSISDAVCNLTDIGPTVAEAAGAAMKHTVDGHSLWPTLTGSHSESWIDETFSEVVDPQWKPRNAPSRMIRSGEWKLWAVCESPESIQTVLYNLQDDPNEENDLAQNPEFADVRERLLARVLEDWDPEWVRRECEQLSICTGVISAWGRAVRPESADALAVPPPEIEADIELL